MILLRAAGWAAGLAAVVCLGFELALYYRTGTYEVLALGRVLSEIDPAAIVDLQEAATGHGPLVEALVTELLRLPAWALTGVPAVACVWAAAPSSGRRRCRPVAESTATSSVPGEPDP